MDESMSRQIFRNILMAIMVKKCSENLRKICMEIPVLLQIFEPVNLTEVLCGPIKQGVKVSYTTS
jgi:hypothetical protein